MNVILPAGGEARGSTYDDFFQAEYARTVRLLFGMTGRLDLAEELTQEALFAASRRWDRVRGLDRPDLWLRRAAINRAISSYRRLVAEAAMLARLQGRRAERVEIVESDPEVWRAVRSLPSRQGAAIVLSAVEGRTAAEIGEILGCSSETARTHLRRGRERLASVLGET